MANCKYYKEQQYVSYNQGNTWQPTDNYRTGQLYEPNSVDCTSGKKWRFFNVDGETLCFEGNKYQKTQEYVSEDGGVTWDVVYPFVFGKGDIVEPMSEDCGAKCEDNKCLRIDIYGYGPEGDKYHTLLGGTCYNQTHGPSHTSSYLLESASTYVHSCYILCGIEFKYSPNDLGGWVPYFPVSHENSYENLHGTGTSVNWYCHIATNYCAVGDPMSLLVVIEKNCSVKVVYSFCDSDGTDALVTQYRWYPQPLPALICDGRAAYQPLQEQVTYDNRRTWEPTGNYKKGDLYSSDYEDCGEWEYQWVLTNDITCVEGSSYYLYKEQRRRDSSHEWEDVYDVTSYDGNGTMEPVIKNVCDSDCDCYVNGLIAGLIGGGQCESPCTGTYSSEVVLCDSVSNILTLDFKDCVTSISDNFAKNAVNLYSVTMTSNVTSIGSSAFQGCGSLINVNLSDGITNLGGYIFKGCYSLEEITLPSKITSVPEGMFSGCTSLRTITLPTGCTSVGEYAFDGCKNLESFSGGTTLQRIGAYAFRGCESFRRVVLSDRITSIGYASFKDCINLEYIKLYSTTPPSMINGPAFENTNDCPIYVPQGSLNAYLNNIYWAYYSSRLVEFEP